MRWAGFVALVALVIAQPAAVSASCAEGAEKHLGSNAIVFVGTVSEVRGGYALVQVERVAKGPDLAPEVWVQGGQDQPPFPQNLVAGVGSSGDVSWSVGARHVIGASSGFRTGDCSVHEPSAIKFVPGADGRAPVVDGSTGAALPEDPVPAALLALGIVVASVITLVVLRRRARRQRTLGSPAPSPG